MDGGEKEEHVQGLLTCLSIKARSGKIRVARPKNTRVTGTTLMPQGPSQMMGFEIPGDAAVAATAAKRRSRGADGLTGGCLSKQLQLHLRMLEDWEDELVAV